MATSDYSSTFTSSSDGDCLFQSPAQIMVRQDIGWEPMGLGGLSRIEVKQKPSAISKDGFEYFIEAYKITSGNEKNLNLECKLDQETSYHRISPTFHCWTTKTSKIGLTFDTFEAADSFERLFNQILKRLDQGHTKSSNMTVSSPMKSISQSGVTKEELMIKMWGSCQHIGQGDIPCPMKCFQSPPAPCPQLHECITSSFGDSLSRHYRSPSAASAPCLLRLNTGNAFESMICPTDADTSTPPVTNWLARLLSCISNPKTLESRISRGSAHSGSCSSPQRPYRNPRTSQDGPSFTSGIHDSSISNEKISNDNIVTWLPAKKSMQSYRPGVLTCVYCRRKFKPHINPPGSCELAPDSARRLVDLLTCRPCGWRFINCFYHNISNPSLSESDLNESILSPCVCCGLTTSHSTPDLEINEAYTSSTHTLRLGLKMGSTGTTPCGGGSGGGGVAASSTRRQQPLKKQSNSRRRRCLLCLVYCLLPCLCCYRSCLACYESCLDRGCVGGRHSVVHHRSQH